MPGLVPGIHVLCLMPEGLRRGWPGHLTRRRASRFCPAMTPRVYFEVLGVSGSRRGQLLRREAAVECLALGRHLDQEFRRGEARAVFGLELVAKLDELPGAHEVDVGQRAAGERRKSKTQDRADIGLTHIGDYVILHGARGLYCLHDKKALLQLLDIERVRIEMLRLQAAQFRPQALLALALLGIV